MRDFGAGNGPRQNQGNGQANNQGHHQNNQGNQPWVYQVPRNPNGSGAPAFPTGNCGRNSQQPGCN
jgi:hypothetical protein